MNSKCKTMNIFEQIKSGLEDSIAFSRGELNLKTVTPPAPPPKAEANHVIKLRKQFRMSQAVFAATLNVSPKTVQSWEQGVRRPADAALRMLQVMRDQPQVVRMLMGRRRTSARRDAARRPHRPSQKLAM